MESGVVFEYEGFLYKRGAHGFTYVLHDGEWIHSSVDWAWLERVAKKEGKA